MLDLQSTRAPGEVAACFIAGQDRIGRAWAYMPSTQGGTFTDSGLHENAASYWLQVRSAGTASRMRLFATSDAGAAPIAEAVRQCR